MGYFMRGRAPADLYRPTVGLFYSAIISIFSSVAAVPITAIALLFGAGGALFIAADWLHRAALAGVIGLSLIYFDTLIAPLHPASLMVDFWPLGMTLTGIWLCALGEGDVRRGFPAIVAGLLLLGVAGCVRGPSLASGAALLALLALPRLRSRQWLAVALLAVSFGAPFALDLAVQRHNGIAGDGVVTLYGFYADPQHVWSAATDVRYLREQPPTRDVISHYLGFLLSPAGAKIWYANVRAVLGHASDLLKNSSLAALLAALAILARGARPGGVRSRELDPRRRAIRVVALSVLVLAAGATLAFELDIQPEILAVGIAALACHAFCTGRRLTLMLTIAFAAALAFHAALGLVAEPRLVPGYEFLLVAALVAAVCESAPSPGVRTAWLRGTAWAACAMLMVGYTGDFWIRTGYKAGLRSALGRGQTAMKVSNSPLLDRSLYLLGNGGLFYSRFDPLPFGTVRAYRVLETPEGIGCATFLHPCAVEWAPPAAMLR
jgi:hypothetical protein